MSEGTDGARLGALHVAQLALRLHQDGGLGLRVDVAADSASVGADLPGGCKFVEGATEFNSLAKRNDIVAKAAFENLRSSFGIDPSALFERAYKLWHDEFGAVPGRAQSLRTALARRGAGPQAKRGLQGLQRRHGPKGTASSAVISGAPHRRGAYAPPAPATSAAVRSGSSRCTHR